MTKILSKIGDRLIVTIKPKHNGKARFTAFSDSWIGDTPTRTLEREYRLRYDDTFETDWQALTLENLNKDTITSTTEIEIRYTRTGEDVTGELEFVDINLEGDFEENVINTPILDASIFSNVAWSEETMQLASNLFRKMYFRGIVPQYITRGDNVDKAEDRDYIDLFQAVTHFFAIIMNFFKRFENFYNDREMMTEWIRQYGIQFDEATITTEQLQELSSNLLDEVRKRGTRMIFARKNELLTGTFNQATFDETFDNLFDSVLNDAGGYVKRVENDGEFIRLIRSKVYNELLFENMPVKYIGWCLGHSSPLYRGVVSDMLNKARVSNDNFRAVENYAHFTMGNSNIEVKPDSGFNVMILSSNGGACGLGRYEEK